MTNTATPSNKPNWQRVQELFDAVIEQPAEARETFLRQSCGGDQALFEEVWSLLQADAEGGTLLDGLAVDAIDFSGSQSLVGEQVGNYRIVREIASGGMGAVYLAERADGQFRQEVALKLIKTGLDTPNLLRRFQSERQILASLKHPNIARLLDGGLTRQGLPYFTMEFVEGEPIDRYCDLHRLPVRPRLELFQTVCEAVQYAHRNLVVHRDLKPGNIMVTADGRVKLLDFGVAKIIDEGEGATPLVTLTQAGNRPMTPEYAAPEQIRLEPVSTASDIYALGVILYELLCGHRPHELAGLTPQEVERAVCATSPQKPSTVIRQESAVTDSPEEKPSPGIFAARQTQPERLRRLLSGDLDNICLKALRKEPEQRYGSAEQMAEDIERHLDGLPIMARPASIVYQIQKFVQRHKLAASTALLVFLLINGLVGFYTRRLADERDRAQLEARKAAEVAAFMTDLFNISDPNEAKGRSITARELLDRGAERIEQDLADQPDVQANMMEVVGTVYQSLAQLDGAEALLTKSIATRKKLHGERDADVARTLWVLGKVKSQRGDYDAADSLQTLALEIRRQLFGGEDERVAECLSSLGKTKYQQGDFKSAESMAREALAIRRKLFGEVHAGVALNLDDLGWLMHEQSRYDEAEALHREALGIRKQLFGDEHLEVAESLNNLGATLYAKGDYQAAEPYMRQALAIRRKLLGEDHPLTTYCLTNLAVLLETTGAYDQAEAFYRDILAAHRRKFGDVHPAVADDLTDLARILTAKRDFAVAESLYVQAVARNRQVRGDEHWVVAYTISGMASMFYDAGEPAKSLPLFKEAIAIYRKTWEKPNHYLASSLVGLGMALNKTGQPEQAEKLLREGLQIYTETLPADHWYVARAQSAVGECLVAQGRYQEAEPMLLQSFETLQQKRGISDRQTKLAGTRIVSLYEKWGKPERADAYRQKGR